LGVSQKINLNSLRYLVDIHSRKIRLTQERHDHIVNDHPEMSEQIDNLNNTLLNPDIIIKSKTDENVELFYRHYDTTPVSEKYLCVLVKVLLDDLFIITAYFTDKIKKGVILWERK
jgi:hypothetical protein